MKICPICNKKNFGDTEYCTFCGASIEKDVGKFQQKETKNVSTIVGFTVGYIIRFIIISIIIFIIPYLIFIRILEFPLFPVILYTILLSLLLAYYASNKDDRPQKPTVQKLVTGEVVKHCLIILGIPFPLVWIVSYIIIDLLVQKRLLSYAPPKLIITTSFIFAGIFTCFLIAIALASAWKQSKPDREGTCPSSVKARLFFIFGGNFPTIMKALETQRPEYLCAVINAMGHVKKPDDMKEYITKLGYIGIMPSEVLPENHPLRRITFNAIYNVLETFLAEGQKPDLKLGEKEIYKQILPPCIAVLAQFGEAERKILYERIEKLRTDEIFGLSTKWLRESALGEFRVAIMRLRKVRRDNGSETMDGELFGSSHFYTINTNVTMNALERDNLHSIWAEILKDRLLETLKKAGYPKNTDWGSLFFRIDKDWNIYIGGGGIAGEFFFEARRPT